MQKGSLWDLLTYILLKNIKKLQGGPLRHLKIFEKSHIVPKKNRKVDLLVSSGFIGYVKKVKKSKGDPLHSVCLGLSS